MFWGFFLPPGENDKGANPSQTGKMDRQAEIDGRTIEAQTLVFFSFSFKTFLALDLETGLIDLTCVCMRETETDSEKDKDKRKRAEVCLKRQRRTIQGNELSQPLCVT